MLYIYCNKINIYTTKNIEIFQLKHIYDKINDIEKEEIMDLYDAIFYRKSTKEFSQKKINEKLFDEVKDVCSNLEINKQDIKAHVIERGHLIHLLMGKKFDIKSPHYILITSNKNDCFYDIGFIAEEIVLKLTVLGVATCYLDMNFDYEHIKDFVINKDSDEEHNIEVSDEDDEIIIPQLLIAFGYSSDDMFREKNEKLDRKQPKNICKDIDKKYKDLLEVVRLSPSYKNCQPWIIKNSGKKFDIYVEKKYRYSDKMIQISMGAFLRHFDLYFKKNEKTITYKKAVHKRNFKNKSIFSEFRKKYLVSVLVE